MRHENEALAGTRDEWEAAIFANASYFTVYAITGIHSGNKKVCGSLPEAIKVATPLHRTLVYAVTQDGRATVLPRTHWAVLLAQWGQLHTYKVRMFPADGGWFWMMGDETFGPWPTRDECLTTIRGFLAQSEFVTKKDEFKLKKPPAPSIKRRKKNG